MCLLHQYDQWATRQAPAVLPADPFTSDDDEYIASRGPADDDALFYDLVLDLIACGADWPT